MFQVSQRPRTPHTPPAGAIRATPVSGCRTRQVTHWAACTTTRWPRCCRTTPSNTWRVCTRPRPTCMPCTCEHPKPDRSDDNAGCSSTDRGGVETWGIRFGFVEFALSILWFVLLIRLDGSRLRSVELCHFSGVPILSYGAATRG